MNLRNKGVKLLLTILSLVAAVIAVLATSTGVFASNTEHQTSHTSIDQSQTGVPSVEVYAVPPAEGPDIWQLYESSIGPTSEVQDLGSGIGASILPRESDTSNNDESLNIYSGSHVEISTTSGSSTALSLPTNYEPDNYPGSVLLTSGGDIYYQSSGLIVEVSANTGDVVRTFALPNLVPDRIAGVIPTGEKIVQSGPTSGSVSALAFDNGDLIAFQYTNRAAAVVDLSTDDIHYLTGYGDLGGGVIAPDGYLYVVAWRSNDPLSLMQVLQIDPSSFVVVSSSSTGLSCSSLDNIETASNSTDNVIVYATLGNVGSPNTSTIWSASPDGLKRLVNLPENVGLYMSVLNGKAYLYGGYAQNVVSSVDLSTNNLSQGISNLQSPVGSYVLAIG